MVSNVCAGKKQIMRQQHLKQRNARRLMPDYINASQIVTKNFLNFFEPTGRDNVAGYWPLKGEIDLLPLLIHLEKLGSNCLLPVLQGVGQPLSFHRWRTGDRLWKSELGVFEPSSNQPSAIPNYLIVPLLAFDVQGNRLGYGGGYYDRTLAYLRGKRKFQAIGVGFTFQQVDDVPVEEFDERVDAIVTEESVLVVSSN